MSRPGLCETERRWLKMVAALNEAQQRWYVADKALDLGRGGVSIMARITGLARSTIYHGISDIRNNVTTPPGRIRKEGAGRKRKTVEDPTILEDLKKLIEPETRGDPMRPLLWTTRSLRNLAKALRKKRHKVSPTVVGHLLRELNYSLQANSKTHEGTQNMRNFATSATRPRCS